MHSSAAHTPPRLHGLNAPRLHGLDTLRASAILLVMLYHCRMQGLLPAALERFAAVGWTGVDLFFVLSGFLIGSQLLQAHVAGRFHLRDFYARRAEPLRWGKRYNWIRRCSHAPSL